MLCPECKGYMNDSSPICGGCGFAISSFDQVLDMPSDRLASLVDQAGVISADAQNRIAERIGLFIEKTGFDCCLVTIDSSAPRLPREFVFWLFNRWKIGGEEHLGMLILLAMQERRIEVEMGHNLEKYLTDDEAAGVLEHHAVPFLKNGDIDNGLYYSLDMLCRIIEHVAAEEKDHAGTN